jgi:hypothetical protein
MPRTYINLLGWLNGGWGALRREVVRQIAAAKAIPCCFTHSASGTFTPPADFKASSFRGLIAWHLVTDATTTRVISYWQDEAAFRYYRPRFESALSLTGTPCWGGAVGDLHARDAAFWPSSLKEALLAGSALLGAATLIWTTLLPIAETVWTKPRVDVTFSSPVFKITEGDTAPITFTARDAEFVPIQVAASAELVGSGSPVPAVLDPSSYQTVNPGTPEQLTAMVKGPAFDQDHSHSPSTDYKLEIYTNSRTWRFQRPTPGKAPELVVRVFPKTFGWDHELRDIAQPGSNPNLVGRLSAGTAYPAGLKGTISIKVPATSEYDINVITPFQPGQPWPPSLPVNELKTIVVEFSSPPLEKYQEMTFQVTITPKSEHAPPEGWGKIEKSLKVRFDKP